MYQKKESSLSTRSFRKIIVPASTSNLGPGFDTLGLAVNRYLTIEAEPSSRLSIEISGEGAGEIPIDERNLTLVAMKRILDEIPNIRMKINNEIPACGGLGASGAAIIGGLLLGNQLAGERFSAGDIYNLAVKLEGHPDNVSAALFGGLIVNARGIDGSYSNIKVPILNKLKLVAILPDSRIETEAARKILPASVSLREAVSNVQHSSLLVAALASGDYEMLRYAVHDELHEKYRKKLIPHFDKFESAAVENGALAFAVSGAGSSCVAFCLDERSSDGSVGKVHQAFAELINSLKLDWRTEILEPVNKGAEIFAD